jgi:hypothetical protein
VLDFFLLRERFIGEAVLLSSSSSSDLEEHSSTELYVVERLFFLAFFLGFGGWYKFSDFRTATLSACVGPSMICNLNTQ